MRKIVFLFCILFFVAPTGAMAVVTPIARTDVVPRQRIDYGESFNFGVVAFSKAGIDYVSFAIYGQKIPEAHGVRLYRN